MKSCLENCRIGDMIQYVNPTYRYFYTVDRVYDSGYVRATLSNNSIVFFSEANLGPSTNGRYYIQKIIKKVK